MSEALAITKNDTLHGAIIQQTTVQNNETFKLDRIISGLKESHAQCSYFLSMLGLLVLTPCGLVCTSRRRGEILHDLRIQQCTLNPGLSDVSEKGAA